MNKYLLVLIIALLLAFFKGFGQTESYQNYFCSPLLINHALSGNFGEPRARHFHMGIDFKTYADGKEMIAVADGYVSRILVSPYGYGLALYVNHPNGYTSVYAHLSEFAPEIAIFVKKNQYHKQSYHIDTLIDKSLFPVKKHQVIAYSGNTGQSEGPHLHFEIRETDTQKPINLLNTVYFVKDKTPPEITHVVFYPLSETARINGKNEKLIVKTAKSNSNYYIKDDIPELQGLIGVGIAYVDRMDDSHNRYGARKVEFFVDNQKVYHSTIDKLCYEKQRNKNSMFDYQLFVDEKLHVHKLFVEPANDLDVYDLLINDGYLNIEQGKTINFKAVITDYADNYSILEFSSKADSKNYTPQQNHDTTSIIDWNSSYLFIKDELRLEFDSASVFYEMPLKIENIGQYKYSNAFIIGDEKIPLKKDFKVMFYLDEQNKPFEDKLFIARRSNGKFGFLKPTIEFNYIAANSSYFGDFYLWVDTTPPKITPVNIKNGANMSGSKFIRVKIEDDLSGIAKYDMFINDVWVLAEYDPRIKSITYYFDDKMPKSDKYQLKVVVSDQMKNVSTSLLDFKY